MRIGVISDSHGDVAAIRQVLKRMGEIAMLLHAGDHYADAAAVEPENAFPVRAVRGNCDFGTDAPEQQLMDCAGKKILLLHGHQYNVKRTYVSLIAHAQMLGPDVVVFGHTHVPAVFTVGIITFFNPGSLSYPRGRAAPSYGVIEVERDGIIPHLHPLPAARRYFGVF